MRRIAFALSLIFIFCIPWEGVIELPGLGTGTKLIGFVLLALWAATVVTTNRLRKPALFQIIVCIFVLWNAVTVFWSGDPSRTVTHLVTWIQLIALIYILWDLYTTRTAVMAGLQAFILGEYVAISIAGFNFFSGNVFYSHYQRFSPSSQSNPDGFGFMVVLGIPLAWYLASSQSITKMDGLLKIVNYAYIPAAFLGLVLSGTRTAMIAAVVGMAFGIASLNRVRLAARIVIFVMITSIILILLPQVQTLKSFQRFGTLGEAISKGDLNQREDLWREGLAAFEEHPFTGVGSNMYRSVNSLGKLAHNSFISVLVEGGLIGFLLFLIIVMIAFVQALRHPRWDAAFWLTLLLVWAIGAFTLTYEYRKATWLFLSLLVVSAALPKWQDEDGVRVQPGQSAADFAKHAGIRNIVTRY